MREILYKKRQSVKHRRKVISIYERAEDKECKTYIRKSFAYIVSLADKSQSSAQDPEIYIKKYYDSKTQTEQFSFKVKGSFFMTKERYVLKVEFCHTLRILIAWKSKVFSPKKSATLT